MPETVVLDDCCIGQYTGPTMNEGYRYTIAEYDREDSRRLDACKTEILEKLADSDHISVMELMSLTRHAYDVMGAAMHELELSGRIRKTYEVTGQQNALVGYELVKE